MRRHSLLPLLATTVAVIAALFGQALLLDSVALAGGGSGDPPDYCIEGSSNACFSKPISGQGTFFDGYYCKISHYDDDCVTCFTKSEDTCYPPSGPGSAPGYTKMQTN